MIRRTATALALLIGVIVPGVLTAQETPRLAYEEFTLDNGLRVLVHEDNSVPIVAVNLWYDVGSANEELGRSGFAHLFEHMLFEETEHLVSGDFSDLIQGSGGTYNGTTNEDRTAYFEIMPSNRLNLALWLEAERMRNLRVTAENFGREREVVKEERRMRIDNQPYGSAFLTLDTLSTNYDPYRHTVIGSMDDLEAATTEDVMSFYRRYYVPNNATLVLAGDVTVAQARALTTQYFGAIPRGEEPPALPPIPSVPRRDGERRVVIPDDMATTPLFMMAHTIPPAEHEDVYALQLLASILTEGESSRMHERLVREEEAAAFIGGGLDARRGPGNFNLFALPNQGVTVERIEALVEEELNRIRERGVTPRELQKAKNQARANTIMGRQTVFSISMDLQTARFYGGDVDRVNSDLDRLSAVTIDDIRRVARTYLVPDNRTVVVAEPAADVAPEGEPTT
ncbi:MAG TPA: pitrilysin family protein [Longimicrobiales bacterium]|nr:pitrilysin family protein [Longimicrobiales bacterium]